VVRTGAKTLQVAANGVVLVTAFVSVTGIRTSIAISFCPIRQNIGNGGGRPTDPPLLFPGHEPTANTDEKGDDDDDSKNAAHDDIEDDIEDDDDNASSCSTYKNSVLVLQASCKLAMTLLILPPFLFIRKTFFYLFYAFFFYI